MIIRNPYGFIAKHYKIINILLIIPIIYLTLKFGDVATFFYILYFYLRKKILYTTQ